MDDSSMPRASRLASFVKLFFSLAIIIIALLAIVYRQHIVDTITVYRYEPTSEISALASRSAMNERGEFLFYASRPVLSDREEFVAQCRAHNEETAILGCYSAMRIYLFDIDDDRLDGVKEVTAAHEMLHAAYDRLSDTERQEVNALVEEGYREVGDERLESLLETYEESQPGQRANELFAILGTEYHGLPDELERWYERYFTDRTVVVELANQYQSTFDRLSQRQTETVAKIDELVDLINSESDRYNRLVTALSRDVSDFNQRAENGTFSSQSEFDQERNALVTRQSELSAIRADIDNDIEQYDRLVAQLDDINIITGELNQSINPNLSEAPEL